MHNSFLPAFKADLKRYYLILDTDVGREFIVVVLTPQMISIVLALVVTHSCSWGRASLLFLVCCSADMGGS